MAAVGRGHGAGSYCVFGIPTALPLKRIVLPAMPRRSNAPARRRSLSVPSPRQYARTVCRSSASDVASVADRDAVRSALAKTLPLDPARPWLLAAAPMRPGAALASWRLLGRSLGLIADPPWQLLAVGDGEVRALVEEALAPIGPGRVVLAGAVEEEGLPSVYAACDLYVWPAYREALSMAVLEAQAAGLPVVAQDWPGAAAVVAGRETGLLTPRNDDVAFAGAVVELSTDPEKRRAMGVAAATHVSDRHGLQTAAATLQRALDAALAEA